MPDLFHDLEHHPGRIYIAVTLLPLLAFFILLLGGALRAAARPYRNDDGFGATLFRLLGGDTPGRVGAYIATGAIGLAFLLSLTGFIWHAVDTAGHGHEEAAVSKEDAPKEKAEAKGAGHEEAHEGHNHEDKWAEKFYWVVMQPVERPATVLNVGYRIDTLAAVMFLMVSFISTLIFLFSIGYMADELQPVVEDHQVHTAEGHLHRHGRFGRFFLFLSLFCFSMLNLVLADNLFQVFVSWELVGICSYLLIGFYYERTSASNAANKAFITNRVGDAGFIIGMMILWTWVGTFNFQDIFGHIRHPEKDSHGEPLISPLGKHTLVRAEKVPGKKAEGEQVFNLSPTGSHVIQFPEHMHAEWMQPEIAAKEGPAEENEFGSIPYWLLTAAGVGIFLGCVGKSAQFPLHVWLPDAMEGPTPVSALIHAATMVAAGVYLVGRCFPLFTPEARLVIAYTGGITLFVGATIAIVQTDIKKVLAYSTVSQLGYMMLGLGVGGWTAGLFHLVTHAFFKALLFLGSGSVIHGCHHEQEMTRMGGLYSKMKITAITMLIGVLTIAGTPFFSGWYSKDAILAHAIGFAWVHPEHSLLFLLPLVTAGITTFYMFRMWFMTFTGEPRDHHVHEHAVESPWTMTVPLVLLAFFSVTVAWGWPLHDVHASQLHHHLEHHSQHPAVAADHPAEIVAANQLHHLAGWLATGLVAISLVFAWLIYYRRVLDPADAKEQLPGLHRFLWHKWYFDELYSAILVRPALAVASWCRGFDWKAIDGFVDGSARVAVGVSKLGGKFDLGVIDGLANLTGDVFHGLGGRLRRIQTGSLRGYVLFLVLAAIGIFILLRYFATWASAGQ